MSSLPSIKSRAGTATSRTRIYEFAVFPLGRQPLSAKEVSDLEAIAIFSEAFSKSHAVAQRAKVIEDSFFGNVCVVASVDVGNNRRNVSVSAPKEFVEIACEAFGVDQ